MQNLINHIEQLCNTHQITIENHSRGGRAYAKKRKIKIRPVKTGITYFVALHEIAHIVYPKARYGHRLAKEAFAWEWAIMNSELVPTDSIRQMIYRCLHSYERAAIRRPTRFAVPSSDHLFWKLLKWSGERIC